MALYWFEFHPDHGTLDGTVWSFVVRRLWAPYTPRMLAMSAVFGLLGVGVGLTLWLPERRFRGWRRDLWALAESPRLLEVGVGTGKNLPLHPPGIAVTAVDLARRMLARAAACSAPAVAYCSSSTSCRDVAGCGG